MAKRAKGAPPVIERSIYVADEDRAQLEGLLRRATNDNAQEARYLADLASELNRAKVVPRSQIPVDVVAMNSMVRLRDLESGEEETYTLVYPADADIDDNRLSVLAPVGTALLGYRAGDVIEWPVPAGVRRFRIEEVLEQPVMSW